MSDNGFSKKDIQGWLGLYVLVGFVVMFVDIANFRLTYAFYLGFLCLSTGILGFYILHLGTQPDRENAFVRFVQHTVRSFTGDQPPPPPPKCEREVALEHLREKTAFRIVAGAEKTLSTLEAWQQWKKEKRRQVLSLYAEGLITDDELRERFAVIENEYNQGTKDLRGSGAPIFEDS